MKTCPYCKKKVDHLKKHLKKSHFEEYQDRYSSDKEKIQILKKTFEERFRELMREFSNGRDLRFVNKDNPKIFPNIDVSGLVEYSVKVDWHYNDIEIELNDTMIETEYVKQNLNIRTLKKIFTNIAEHEYGHILQFESMFFSFPRDTRQILLEKENPKDISIAEINKCLYSSNELSNIKKSLQNIHYMFIHQSFIEFWANYNVWNKINKEPPNEEHYYILDLLVRKECLYPQNILNPNIPLRKRVFELFEFTHTFFIYDKWEDLSTLFKKYKLDKSLKLYHFLNKFFEEIIKKNREFDLMREDLFELAKILDKINYSELFFQNRVTKELALLLKDYRDYLIID